MLLVFCLDFAHITEFLHSYRSCSWRWAYSYQWRGGWEIRGTAIAGSESIRSVIFVKIKLSVLSQSPTYALLFLFFRCLKWVQVCATSTALTVTRRPPHIPGVVVAAITIAHHHHHIIVHHHRITNHINLRRRSGGRSTASQRIVRTMKTVMIVILIGVSLCAPPMSQNKLLLLLVDN